MKRSTKMAPVALSTSYFTGSAFIGISMITLNASGTLLSGGDVVEGHGVFFEWEVAGDIRINPDFTDLGLSLRPPNKAGLLLLQFRSLANRLLKGRLTTCGLDRQR